MTDEELDLNQEADIELTDHHEIVRLLALTPKLVMKCEEAVQRADEALDRAQDSLDVEKAKMHLKASEDSSLTAAPDRVAWARTQPSVTKAHIAVINAKAELKICQLRARKYENYFTSIRKAANIFETLENAAMARQKYSQN